ncbi:MAG TPA: hypothetical protein VF430_07660 [Verrucomicrobiae bacterium]
MRTIVISPLKRVVPPVAAFFGVIELTPKQVARIAEMERDYEPSPGLKLRLDNEQKIRNNIPHRRSSIV